MQKYLLILCAIPLIIALSACNAPQAADSDPVVLTKANDGGTVSVKKGSVFHVVLEGNITTGYAWEVRDHDPEYLDYSGDPDYQETDSAADGTGGAFDFNFKAVKTGETQLTFVYHRPFEKEVDPIETMEITINITD